MIRTALCLMVLASLAIPGVARAGKSPRGIYLKTIHRDGGKTLPDLFAAELRVAQKKKKQVVIMFSADWCSPCKTIKEFLLESPSVQRKVSKGHILIIDVDEWRGPAHRLIPGVNPRKLPTIVRVDYSGNRVEQCYGTDLGLLSGEAIGANLARLIDGKKPTPPKYESDPELKMALLRQNTERQRNKTKGLLPIEVAVRSVEGERWTVRIVIRNNEAPRRWYVLPWRMDTPLAETMTASAWDLLKFDEHVRAQYLRFEGPTGFYAIPVAGYGYVVLDRWTVEGPESGGSLPIWELNRLIINGTQAKFDRKLPYELNLDQPMRSRVLQRTTTPTKVELKPRKRHEIPLDPI